MSECSEGQRLSGALSGFHGPGLVVVPLRLRWEFPEPVWVRRCGSTCLCFFFKLHLTLKKKKDMKYHNAQSVLLPFWEKVFGCCSSGQVTFQTGTKRDSRRRQHHTFFWYGHIFLFCAVFYLFFFVFSFHCCTTGTASERLWWGSSNETSVRIFIVILIVVIAFPGLILETIFSAISKNTVFAPLLF